MGDTHTALAAPAPLKVEAIEAQTRSRRAGRPLVVRGLPEPELIRNLVPGQAAAAAAV